VWAAAISCSSAPSYRATTLGGERFTNESLKGSVVLVQFWATWCGYCRADQPIVDALDREYRGKGLVVLAVNAGEPKEKVREYLRRSPRSCRVVAAEDTDLVEMLGPRGFPYYVVIDRDGRVAGNQQGSGGERALRGLLGEAGLGAE
jgi:thiol-disulfide isomerase/thioredoxin